MKKFTLRFALPAFLVAAIVGLTAGPAQAAVWSSSDKWGTWSNGGYTLRNDVWGSGAGPQVIWANSFHDWGVWANHPNTGGVKAYPHVARAINRSVDSLGSLSSSFGVTRPGDGAYNTAYDIWCGNNSVEVMIWMNWQGAVGPIGGQVASVSVGGHSWRVHRGSNGANAVISFLRTSNTNSASVDIRAVLRWARGQGYFGNCTISEVQFGWEITSSSGGRDFRATFYSVSFS
jgi:hypothetical protein